MTIATAFQEKLRIGEAVEQHLRDVAERGELYTTQDGPGDYRYDFTLKHYTMHTPIKIEVKYDEKAMHTGNICIEGHKGPGRPSGLTVTDADIVVHYVNPDAVKLYSPEATKIWLAAFGGRYYQGRFRNTDVKAGGWIVNMRHMQQCGMLFQSHEITWADKAVALATGKTNQHSPYFDVYMEGSV